MLYAISGTEKSDNLRRNAKAIQFLNTHQRGKLGAGAIGHWIRGNKLYGFGVRTKCRAFKRK